MPVLNKDNYYNANSEPIKTTLSLHKNKLVVNNAIVENQNVIETSNSFSPIKFDTMAEKEEKMHLNNKIMALIQANGMKMKVTFYLIEEYKKLKYLGVYLMKYYITLLLFNY